MLSATNLTKLYGSTTALDSLCLTITPGEIFCLLGANGAGKTTTINLFLNFIPPTSGTATINGMDVVRHPLETKRFIAYIPEQVNLYRNLTGIENLEYFTALADAEKYSRKQLLEFLRDAGLPGEAAEKRISTYSKGMRQKVGIAIAIAKRAKALLLDEPTSGLDPKASNEFSELLLRMSASGGFDGYPRSLPRERIRNTRGDHAARKAANGSEHFRDRTHRSRKDLPRTHARLRTSF